MKLRQICEKADLKVMAGEGGLDKEVSGVYICDLLSWVMSHAQKGDIWITVQTHTNVIAVATLLELSAIIVPEGMEIEPDTLKKADMEDVPVLASPMSAFQLSKAMLDLGIGC